LNAEIDMSNFIRGTVKSLIVYSEYNGRPKGDVPLIVEKKR